MKNFLLMLAVCLSLAACSRQADIYNFTVKDGAENEVKMSTYKGKVLLIVNTATRCGFTPQYEELEAIYEKYHDRGLEILDFPCNQFGQQAPGSYDEIHSFCTLNYNIKFPQFAKIDVNGDNASPLFTYLKSQQGFGGFNQNDPRGRSMHQMLLRQDENYQSKPDIKWNFTKFLVDRKGNVARRFEPTDPMEDVDKAIADMIGQ